MKTCSQCGGQLPDPTDPIVTRPMCRCVDVQDDLYDDDRMSPAYEEDERRWAEDPMGLGGI